MKAEDQFEVVEGLDDPHGTFGVRYLGGPSPIILAVYKTRQGAKNQRTRMVERQQTREANARRYGAH